MNLVSLHSIVQSLLQEETSPISGFKNEKKQTNKNWEKGVHFTAVQYFVKINGNFIGFYSVYVLHRNL